MNPKVRAVQIQGDKEILIIEKKAYDELLVENHRLKMWLKKMDQYSKTCAPVASLDDMIEMVNHALDGQKTEEKIVQLGGQSD